MIQKKNLTPLILAGIFVLMLGLSYAAVPLYDLFCRVTGFGGTTQVSNSAPKIVLNKIVSVRFDTNVNNLPWDFKAKSNVIDVKVGQKIKQGQIVGTLGQSGRATGPHLDIRLNWFNIKLDPKTILK